jgi:cyclopropane fatty-acyl-phospholipid synthase-like methyltransferase
MGSDLSPRLAAVVDALPLRPGLRVLEIGCGSGAAAREVARRIGDGHVLAIDRSAKAIAQARAGSRAEIESGRLSLRTVPVEDFELEPGEAPFDISFAVRVGALDGRHPRLARQARERIAAALTPRGRLFIDGGDPLREVSLAERAAPPNREAPMGR